ncbi:MAG: cysteine--tRNA ligase [Tenericutes bacterium]|nr:cysteine--tRNA ligase [Mycoplasmatota bacterium]MDY5992941.1 cysteine--tRNA ligase [Bacilli bacterium]
MKIFNTLSKKVEEFIPNEEGKVKMYTCGPTVYSYAHIGNLRTYISEDILEKSLKFLGYDVERVMNITDVGHLVGDGDTGEDKMLVAAKREHKSSLEIAKFYTDCFFDDCCKLNIRKPDIVSNATDNIDMYIKIITKLLETGYAYISNGNVYYDTSKFPNYYELSGRNSDDLLVAVRSDIEVDDAKRNPFDFGLWFTNSKFNNQELQWDSPWGRGYPGWHIECSGISIKYLGEKLDIHCGAEDAIFPHHTNEIAQSEAYLGIHPWCKYWVHYGFLNNKNGKMSKSSGEFLTVSLLEEKGYNPLSYRYLCLNSYYHNQLTFDFDILSGAEKAYLKLKSRISKLGSSEVDDSKYEEYLSKFKNYIEDDLNTSNMITLVYDILKDTSVNDGTKRKLIEKFDEVLSLDLLKVDEVSSEHDDEEILKKIELRNEAKKNKDFVTADAIRDELLEQGVRLIDTREGTTYELI